MKLPTKLEVVEKPKKKQTVKKTTVKRTTKPSDFKIPLIEKRLQELEQNIQKSAFFLSRKHLNELSKWIEEKILSCERKKAWGKQYAYKEVLIKIQTLIREWYEEETKCQKYENI